jgi:ABC-type uncharacterized transport system ATPase subunit
MAKLKKVSRVTRSELPQGSYKATLQNGLGMRVRRGEVFYIKGVTASVSQALYEVLGGLKEGHRGEV